MYEHVFGCFISLRIFEVLKNKETLKAKQWMKGGSP